MELSPVGWTYYKCTGLFIDRVRIGTCGRSLQVPPIRKDVTWQEESLVTTPRRCFSASWNDTDTLHTHGSQFRWCNILTLVSVPASHKHSLGYPLSTDPKILPIPSPAVRAWQNPVANSPTEIKLSLIKAVLRLHSNLLKASLYILHSQFMKPSYAALIIYFSLALADSKQSQ